MTGMVAKRRRSGGRSAAASVEPVAWMPGAIAGPDAWAGRRKRSLAVRRP